MNTLRVSILLQAFIAIDLWTASRVLAEKHRCYVCVPNTGSVISDVLQTFPEGPNIPLCNQFATSKAEYIRKCPNSSYQGCLTQTNGTHVTKTCTEVGLEDCKTANKITYCYCKGDLCNREPVPFVESTIPPETSREDDEDILSEGSGSYAGLESKQIETSSEIRLGLEIIRNNFPTTTKTVILTTVPPNEDRTLEEASGNISIRPFYVLNSISIIFLLAFL